MVNPVLSAPQVERFISEGFLHLPGAFSPALADVCRAILWQATGLSPEAPATWTQPVVRLGHLTGPPFRQAANSPLLHAAFDQLVGEGRWLPQGGLGTFPVRFPHPGDAGDTGWHCDGSYVVEGDPWPWLNVHSQGRALLMLFLFSDVGPTDALPASPLQLARADSAYTPVERAIRLGLGQD